MWPNLEQAPEVFRPDPSHSESFDALVLGACQEADFRIEVTADLGVIQAVRPGRRFVVRLEREGVVASVESRCRRLCDPCRQQQVVTDAPATVDRVGLILVVVRGDQVTAVALAD